MNSKLLKKEFGKIFITEERTFGGVVVFLYSGIANFLKLIDATFERSPVNKFEVNLGMNMSGVGKFDNKTRVYLVWVNSKMRPDPLSAVAPFVHEILHMVDTMVEKAGVKDSTGETRAYLVERYTEFGLHKRGLTDGSALDETKSEAFAKKVEQELNKLPKENYEQVEKKWKK